ncbi:hypothetical protein EYR40_009363 [Pleurotus pulmonarius]|nr:hypothetical protein EYR36_005256 [Pleurotus pulmonarius]KAF4590244.1 hypothetical protein EYR38_009542 [Pleurotus pulmonarius]KAF4590766.1 hypothetical protein EYR40_009363 [Pleurotus pulmonarius]
MTTRLVLISLCLPWLCLAEPTWSPSRWFWRRATRDVPPEGFHNPLDKGGSMLTQIPVTFPEGLGEPLNIIISGNSDEQVLKETETDGGLLNFFLSFGFSSECLGQHMGSNQAANLGDGHGYLNETAVIRWNYGDPALGACKESIEGGNHFRYWVQNGPEGNSGSIFMAVSYELPISLGHDIVANGYNFGRDWLVGNMTNTTVPTAELTNTTTYTTNTFWGGYTYLSEIKYVSGLLSNSSDGINHYLSVGLNGTNAIDGLVAVITTKITARPTSSSATWTATPFSLWTCIFILFVSSASVVIAYV